ncbi:unnamed protein product [Adineta steineri]|uniref:Cytochrome P450 n=1 Tax=Adineta steineri TaxID=433720 RepID=A0A814HS13_9BILA|nr:unnamed protein product [Adineta steineri]CAF1251732.1 unnamed protein product [Adineta steineri]
MLILLIFSVIILLILYIKNKYFTLRDHILGLSPHFLFGNVIQSGFVYGRSRAQIFEEYKQRYGDIFQFFFGPIRLIVVSNTTDVQHIFTHRNIYEQGYLFTEQFSVLFPSGFITLTGSKHKRHAAIAMPLFRRARIIDNFDLIVDCTDKLLSNWRISSSQHIHCDIVAQCQNLLLQIFGLISFDYDLEALDQDDPSKNELTKALHDFMSACELVLVAPRILGVMYTKLSRRHRRAKSIITRYIYQMIDNEMTASEESRAQRKRTCLIASLIASLQEDEEMEAKKSENEKKGLSRAEVLQEMLAFMIAGFETTSTALAWFIHFMSKYPHVQQKIKEELIKTGGEQDLTLNRLDSLVYLDCAINESLRYAPPADGTMRTLIADDRLPECGIHLHKGDNIFIPFYNLAHDERYWSIDPKLFYPERFLNEDKNHHLYALIPFGSGHRQCIGQDLARFELKVIIARMMQQVTFIDGGPTVNSGGHITSMTILPKNVGVGIEFA